MKVRHIHIQNYRAIANREISFLDGRGEVRPVTVLAGPNGSGKTSVLFALVQALRGAVGYHTKDVPPPTRDDIRTLPSQWSEIPPEVAVDVGLWFDYEERQFIPEIAEKLSPTFRPPSLDDGSIRVHWKYPPGFKDGKALRWAHVEVEPRLPSIRTWLKIKAQAIKAWNDPTRAIPIRFADVQRLGGIEFFPQDRSLRSRVLGQRRSKEEAADADSRNEAPVAETLRYLSEFARNRTDRLSDDENPEKLIQRAFHLVCSPKKYVGYLYREDDPLGSPVLEDCGERYPLAQAASGEQVVLEYITRLLRRGPMNKLSF